MTEIDHGCAGDSQLENVDVFVAALRRKFGDRAIAVSERQCAMATGEQETVWCAILTRLKED